MKKLNYLLLSVFALGLILTACKAKKEAAQTPPPPPPPYWVTERPSNPAYYIGIGIAGKATAGPNYMAVAKENALNDLASEIKVNVSGNSVLYTMENETGFKSDFQSTTKLSSSVDLEGFEQSGVYETPDSYYIYYKLSKAKYKEIRDQKINTAISLSKQSRDEGKTQAANGNYAQAIKNYYQALIAIEPYLNEPLKTTIDGKEIYYGSMLVKELQELANQLEIAPVTKEYSITQGNVVPDEKTAFTITSKVGKAQSEVQVRFTMGDEVLLQDKAISDHTGRVSASVGKIKDAGRNILKADIVSDVNSKTSKVIAQVLKSIQWPSSAMVIQVESPKVYLIVSQWKYGSATDGSLIRDAFNAAAISNSFVTINDKAGANLVATIKLDCKQSGVFQDLYTVTFNGHISFIDVRTNNEIFRESFNGMRGVDLNYDRAYDKGLAELKKRLVYETIPRFRRKNLD